MPALPFLLHSLVLHLPPERCSFLVSARTSINFNLRVDRLPLSHPPCSSGQRVLLVASRKVQEKLTPL